MKKFSLPYDVFERHKKVGSFIGRGETVLDVGGQLNLLAQFSKPAKIVVANLGKSQEASDIKIKKDKLPFKNNSFSTVCAVDVIEHIPSKKRNRFLKELLRVAGEKIILSFPIGTEKHIEYEKEIKIWLSQRGKDVAYLDEHINYGLPKAGQILKITKEYKTKIFYSGNLRANKYLFKLLIFDPNVVMVRKIVYFVKIVFNFLTNSILYIMLSQKDYSQNIVRAYLVIEK